MASGFQQDTNQLLPNFYRVAVDMSNTTYYPTINGNNNGGITPNSWDSFTTANVPSTIETSYARARGNLRFRNVVNSLAGLTDCQILDVTITEADADAQAQSIAFTVKFERDSFVPLTSSRQGAATTGNNVNGDSMDTIAKAVANAVAIGIHNAATATTRIYNPAYMEGFQLATTAVPAGTAAQYLSTVTVTLINTVTIVNA
jgi:hypothetical protein